LKFAAYDTLQISSIVILTCLPSYFRIWVCKSFGMITMRMTPCFDMVPANFSISANKNGITVHMLYSLLYYTMFIYNTIVYYSYDRVAERGSHYR
jgi:hypothetical protein